MKSIGRAEEFKRVVGRLESFQSGAQRFLHMAIAAPAEGGLAEFLDDIFEVSEKSFTASRVNVDDHLSPDHLLEDLNRVLSRYLGEVEERPDGTLQTTIDLLARLRKINPGRKALLVADVSSGLNHLRAEGFVANSAATPLLARLRAIANKIEDDELPLAIVLGWSDDFRGWAAQVHAGDVVDRYAPAETLFADFGKGRGAWSTFKEVIQSYGIEVSGDYPGICGSGLPAGAFAVAARAAGRPLDGRLLLEFLRRRSTHSASRQPIAAVPADMLIDLCLRDAVLKADPRTALVEPRAEGGYIATRELYAILGLVPPREIVSFADRVRQRLEDHDPTLATEIGEALAALVAQGTPTPSEEDGWRISAGPLVAEKHPLNSIDVLLLVSLQGDLSAAQKSAAAAFAVEAEQSVSGLERLLIVVHHSPRAETPLRRELLVRLTESGIENPRPADEEVHPTTGRFLAILCSVELSADQIIAAARYQRDRSNDGGLGKDLTDRISAHLRQVQRKMPNLKSDSVLPDVLGRFIAAYGDPIEMSPTAAAPLVSLGIVQKTEGKHFVWRWRDDAFLQRIARIGSAGAQRMSSFYCFDANAWNDIGLQLAAAYSADLLIWGGDALKSVSPVGLLQHQADKLRQKIETDIAAAPEHLCRHSTQELQQILAVPVDVESYEFALEALIALRTKLQNATQAELRRARELAERIDAAFAGIEATDDLPSDLQQQISDLRRAPASDQIVGQVREIALKIAQERDRQRQRGARLDPLRRDVEKLAPEKREAALNILNNQTKSVEEIRAEVEEMRVNTSPMPPKSQPKPTPKSRPSGEDPVQAEKPILAASYHNTPEDLERLAELYREPTNEIISLEIKT